MNNHATSFVSCFLCNKKNSGNHKNINETCPSSLKSVRDVLLFVSKNADAEVFIPKSTFLCVKCFSKVIDYDNAMLEVSFTQKRLSKLLVKTAMRLDSDCEAECNEEIAEIEKLNDNKFFEDCQVSDTELDFNAIVNEALELTPKNSKINVMENTNETIINTDANIQVNLCPGFSKVQQCEKCGKVFHSYSGFYNHLNSHKEEKQSLFKCTQCDKSYDSKYKLKHHTAWHSGEKPFQCEICQKRFVHRKGLQVHSKIHLNQIRSLECTVCGNKFLKKYHLERHMMSHTGAKPFCCPICGKCFTQMYNMKVHIREHEKPGSTRRSRLKCTKCSRTFTSKQKYEHHIEVECQLDLASCQADMIS